MTAACVLAADCPPNYYGDSTTTFCETTCTVTAEYGDNSTKKCQTSCSSGFKQADIKVCVETCPA